MINGLETWKDYKFKGKLENTFKNDVYSFFKNVNSKYPIKDSPIINGSPVGIITWFKTSASFFQADGLPDIIACVNGKFFAIELKQPNGVLDFNQ